LNIITSRFVTFYLELQTDRVQCRLYAQKLLLKDEAVPILSGQFVVGSQLGSMSLTISCCVCVNSSKWKLYVVAM